MNIQVDRFETLCLQVQSLSFRVNNSRRAPSINLFGPLHHSVTDGVRSEKFAVHPWSRAVHCYTWTNQLV